jgi:hypothetical protein
MSRPTVFLPQGGLRLAQSNMDEIVVGRWDAGRRGYHYTWEKVAGRTGFPRADEVEKPAHGKLGIWTGGVSDCMVVCAAYYSQNICQQFWFQHVQGGLFKAILESIEAELDDCPDVGRRYALIAAGNDSGPDEIAAHMVRIGFQNQNVKIYVTGTGNRGFAFGLNFVDGYLGEVTHGGAELPHDPDKMVIL